MKDVETRGGPGQSGAKGDTVGVLPGDPSQRDEDRAEVREEEHGPRKARHAGASRSWKRQEAFPRSLQAHFRPHTPGCTVRNLLSHQVCGLPGQSSGRKLYRTLQDGESGLLLKAGTALAVEGRSPAPELPKKTRVDEAGGWSEPDHGGPRPEHGRRTSDRSCLGRGLGKCP